ncbi:cytochrome ubiquinol oxidase subunit I [Thermobispora bispora]|jgi:cytochrome d ubiquinol oxidase subunit I|uniref:cytochrome ubiquinol oxidase subunit I n=1 Tax=Thermobispora bispora TaxID=2006 RepID=UPI001981287F|nr:cytochrome ubiquinol oxidase subunit I [Thermobispora bispora]MBO2472803.1 cytochrome ubiquinol oxidase subunit I [Actinomycetales bacterium]MDI9581566.1 cytochrome ubiquinol oxidase subunit I [Thermobispora sp.]QSI47401.1 cytochrome ubiquinol oxidase subunit I [Thermobispora bispora]
MTVLDLARLQFALTAGLHFLFVVLTLGLAPLVAILNTRWVRTGNPVHERMTRFWGQIYVINYALGIVTGLVMEFQIGLNWSGLIHYAGDVFGAPLAMETLVAFFLESTFLGLWIFGWHRLPRGLHLACIWLVALTAYASAFLIMLANSFLQQPVGVVDKGDRLELVDFGALLTNSTLVFSFPHVIAAGLVAGSFVMIGASAYGLRRHPGERELFTRSLRLGVVVAALGTTMTSGFGYAQFAGVQEGKFTGEGPAQVALGVMTLIGDNLILVALFVLLPLVRWLPRWRRLHPFLIALTPLPFIAAIAGWLARELGRQPWVIWQKLSVADALTPGLTPGMLIASSAAFTGVVGVLAIIDYLLIARVIRRGPTRLALGAGPEVPEPAPVPSL